MKKMNVNVKNVEAVRPLISVILPVYNAQKYLAEAVDSILAQTFANFELIVINDGSTDGSQEILSEYERLDSRVRVIARENRGLATTLNDLISIAQGTWIARMDADDIALPLRFERQLEWLERTGADISGSWVQRFGTSDRRVVRLHQNDEAIKMEIMFSSPFAHPAVMVRAELLKQLGYDSVWDKAEDYDLWVRAAAAGWKMTNVPEVLLLYRVHGEQISARAAILQQQQGQEIRRRYWEFVHQTMHLNRKWIDKALKLFEYSSLDLDMDGVDAAFAELLQHSHGVSRDVIFNQMTRLYFYAAANCPDIVVRWRKLNREFGDGWGISTSLKLWLFRLLRIRMNSGLFRQIRKMYIWRASW